MGKKHKDNKKTEPEVVVVEFKVSMHCNACERTVAKAISKFKGVEKFITDMTKHKVVVTGKINPEKVLKKLRKKTGKRVEIVSNAAEAKKEESKAWDSEDRSKEDRDSESVLDEWRESVILTMFSDENPNACLIM